MRFWETERGKVIGYAVHETNASIGHIKNTVLFLKEKRKDDVELVKRLNTIEESLKRFRDGFDYMYEKLQKLEGY